MDITNKLKNYKIKEVNKLLEKLAYTNNLDKRMDICDDILMELEENDIDTFDIEDDVKDLAIG
jgi:hypothetical protein